MCHESHTAAWLTPSRCRVMTGSLPGSCCQLESNHRAKQMGIIPLQASQALA